MRHLLTAVALTAITGPALGQEITVWDWKSGDPVLAAYYEMAKSEFEAAHPGVTISYVMQPHDQYYTILGTALASDAGPDLILLHGGAQTRARTGALVRLDEAVAEVAGSIVGWEEFTGEDGGIYAIPLSIQGFVVYYNKQRYAEAGLDPETPPTTWDALVAACEAITQADTVPCFAMGNKEGFGAEFFFSAVAANALTDQEQADWAAGALAWSSPQVRAILEAWVETQSMGWYNEGANSTAKFMDEYEMFMRGDAANTIGLISDVAHWKQFGEFLGDDNLGVFRHPSPTVATDKQASAPEMPFAGGIGYGVNRSSPDANLALEFALALASPAPMQVFFNDAGVIPANTMVDTGGLSSPSAVTILGWLADSGAVMAHTNMSTAELEEWHRQSQLLLNGETTVDAAVERLDQVQAETKG